MRVRIVLFIFISLGWMQNLFATGFGIHLSIPYPTVFREPDSVEGVRAAVSYLPPSFIWNGYQLSFDMSYSQWWVDEKLYQHHRVDIFSVSPLFRYYFLENPFVSLFGEASIGLSYLTHTRLEDYDLGIHFTFQDRLNLGVAFGTEKHLSVSLGALHYSNGHMAEYNRGITSIFMLDVGYRF